VSGGGCEIAPSAIMGRLGGMLCIRRRECGTWLGELPGRWLGRPAGRALGSGSGAFNLTAPSFTSLSMISPTCSIGRPVTVTISATLARPSMRENTNPSSADRGKLRTSSPETSSGTLWCDDVTRSRE
jgi:hypothetical protein